MRLIDADALPKYTGYALSADEVAMAVEHAPTIDAVPVVRCRDCVWWTKQEASCQGRCARLGIYPTGAWYCANGAKMDEGGTDGTDDR